MAFPAMSQHNFPVKEGRFLHVIDSVYMEIYIYIYIFIILLKKELHVILLLLNSVDRGNSN